MPSYRFGAGFIGILVSAVLLGITYMQTIYYFLGKSIISWVMTIHGSKYHHP
jgi:hypothetical protein